MGAAPAGLSVLGSSAQPTLLPPNVQPRNVRIMFKKQHRWVGRLTFFSLSRTKGLGVGGESRASGKGLQSWAPSPNPFDATSPREGFWEWSVGIPEAGIQGSRSPPATAARALQPPFRWCPLAAAGPGTLMHWEVVTAKT